MTVISHAPKMPRMTEKFIPEHIDPFRYAEQGLGLSGTLNVADMQRLLPSVIPHADVVTVDLQFGIDEQGVTFLKGILKTTLRLQCQRCMEPFVYEIISDFALGIVDTLDEAKALPEHYEPALAQEGMLALRDLIEDEIILNLPLIPKHSPEECKVTLPQTDSGWEQEKEKNPFHVLKSLKHTRR